jgi:hypothetical protein
MIYSIGSLLVVKSVDEQKDKYLKGHSAKVSFITVSQKGNLIASGEVYDYSS